VQSSSVNYIHNGFYYNNITELFSALQSLICDDFNKPSNGPRNGTVWCSVASAVSRGLPQCLDIHSQSSVVDCVDYTAENGETNTLRLLVQTDNSAQCRHSKSAFVTNLGKSLH
jgi:hypothetical protein